MDGSTMTQEMREFHYLKSRDTVFAQGYRDARAGKESAYPTYKKFDCIKNRYQEGYANGLVGQILL